MLETSQLAAADLVARRAKEFLAVLDGCDEFDNALQAYSNLRSALETYAELRVDCAVLDPHVHVGTLGRGSMFVSCTPWLLQVDSEQIPAGSCLAHQYAGHSTALCPLCHAFVTLVLESRNQPAPITERSVAR